MHVRTSEQRWMALASFVRRLERMVEWTARIEGVQYASQSPATRDPWRDEETGWRSFARDLDRLDRAVDWQLDQLTAEYLYFSLKRRAAQDRASALHASAQDSPDVVVKIA